MNAIPSKETRDEWRKLAQQTMLVSALGEYTPEEFEILLDAVDVLERERDKFKAERDEARREAERFRAMHFGPPPYSKISKLPWEV